MNRGHQYLFYIFNRNAHFRRAKPEPSLVVVEGDPHRSHLFNIALQLSDGSQKYCTMLKMSLGLVGL